MVDNYDEKLNQNVVFLGGTRGLIIMYGDVSERIGTYRNVSGCIGGRFFSQKSSPIRSDTSRYVHF